jgi:vesicle-fusing ATPase
MKEALIGIGVAVVVFLVYQGVNVFPILFLFGLGGTVYFLIRSNLKVSDKRYPELKSEKRIPQTSFSDIGGQKVAQNELKEALEFIIHADKIKKMGIRPLKGILLSGPPGTGKTLLAKAAASYTDSVFLHASGSEFIEMYAGVGAQRVRKIFQKARDTARKRKKKSAIIFIDEIEVLCGKRGRNPSHNEYDQTLNQLLVEMDGLSVDEDIRILLIGATNRIDILDPAILRPGRFDRVVQVDLPDKEGRRQILHIHTKNKPLAEDVDLDKLAQETFGFSGAHLESLANEAAILSMRQGKNVIDSSHLREALEKVMIGEKIDRKPDQKEKERVAVHELGHGLLSELNRPNSVVNITVVPRGKALGYMRQSPKNDSYLHTKEELENQIAQLIAGAIAEEVFLGSRSTGANNDFKETVHLAKEIIHSGMSPLGIVGEEFLDKRSYQETIKTIIQEQEVKVRGILNEYFSEIERVKGILLKQETISGEEFRKLLGLQQDIIA